MDDKNPSFNYLKDFQIPESDRLLVRRRQTILDLRGCRVLHQDSKTHELDQQAAYNQCHQMIPWRNSRVPPHIHTPFKIQGSDQSLASINHKLLGPRETQGHRRIRVQSPIFFDSGYVDRDAVSTNEIALDPRSVIQYDDYLEDSTKIIGDGSVQNSNGRRRKANPPTEMTYPHKMPRTNERKDSHAGGAKARNLLPVFEFSDPSNDPSIPKGPRADYISAEKPYPIDKYKWNSQNDVSDQIEPTKSAPAPPIPQKTTAISPAVLIELSKIAEDGTIFTILEQIRRMQVDREEELFDQRKKLLEEHDKERNKLHAKEILGALDPREVEALERKLFTELRTLDKSIVAEMDKIVQKQQQALQDANVPLFFTTTDKDAIAKQHKILGLLSEMAP
ncbi:hypothetical protein K493DRAFT_356427 [Basidiobolus meristosporus CBS 931.73]|uniref:Uncharacterized protein n=1 Tax=Basidiobolus meristosporus CBS 931.73 TaxID=1314790 RepID=A0A1Y1XYC4_9FUNG|nr:hypothetical protein K493DRAFT_356427 [Basidiobolus meristosporus CBS 931.73]|eukprot:ORX90750.1 hypothetical protein K493DRAFT_356427 [Basidiobolus meristosporus CBS 931.73]